MALAQACSYGFKSDGIMKGDCSVPCVLRHLFTRLYLSLLHYYFLDEWTCLSVLCLCMYVGVLEWDIDSCLGD